MKYAEARQYARELSQVADGRAFLDFLVQDMCGVGNPISGITPEDNLKAIGAYNVGVEIREMTKEQE